MSYTFPLRKSSIINCAFLKLCFSGGLRKIDAWHFGKVKPFSPTLFGVPFLSSDPRVPGAATYDCPIAAFECGHKLPFSAQRQFSTSFSSKHVSEISPKLMLQPTSEQVFLNNFNENISMLRVDITRRSCFSNSQV